MSTREEKQQDRKAQILDAAAALFADQGYYKTTTADVARSVGVTQPYIFHFFKSKEELYLAVLEQACAKIIYAFSSVEAPPELLPEAMGKAFGELLEQYSNEILLVMMSYATPEESIRARVREQFDTVFERIVGRFAAAGIPDPKYAAGTFFGQGLLITMSKVLQLPKLAECVEHHADLDSEHE